MVLMLQAKEGGMSISHYETSDFATIVQLYELVDLRSLGCRLTWTNDMVSMKLDRTMTNTQ